MAKPRKPNLFNLLNACIRYVLMWLVIIVQVPIILMMPIGRISVGYFRFVNLMLMKICGVKTRVYGNISKKRPLLIVGNHISMMEASSFAIAFGGGFFGKKEIEKFPLLGWMGKKFGMIYVDRRPSHAMDALRNVEEHMKKSSYPMFLFPEGTTTNGAYVKKFKSTLFNFINETSTTIQPVVITYRYPDGSVIDDETLANDYAYFANSKQDMGPLCKRERSLFGQAFHVMLVGGFIVEITVLPVPPLAGMDRKEIADTLHKIISEKYMELKDK